MNDVIEESLGMTSSSLSANTLNNNDAIIKNNNNNNNTTSNNNNNKINNDNLIGDNVLCVKATSSNVVVDGGEGISAAVAKVLQGYDWTLVPVATKYVIIILPQLQITCINFRHFLFLILIL